MFSYDLHLLFRKLIRRALSGPLMWAAVAIPLTEVGQWQTLSFESLPKHELQFSEKGLVINVKKSAMPLIYPLAKPMSVQSVSVSGELSSLLNLPKSKKQGDKCCDDFALKVGLVVSGSQRLNWLQKKLAASWVLKLFELAPEDGGIENILFLNAVQEKSLVGRSRNHPLNEELLKEKNVWLLDQTGKFSFEHTLGQPLSVVAIWLSVDGDDTQSEYKMTLKTLALNPES